MRAPARDPLGPSRLMERSGPAVGTVPGVPTRRLPAAIALAAWSLFVWTTRIGNIWRDDALSTGERWGRTGLALSFTVLALAVGHGVWHRAGWRPAVTKVLAAWTVAVWVVRSVGIAGGGHEAAFVAVHLVLAAVSIAISVAAWREAARRLEPAASPRTHVLEG